MTEHIVTMKDIAEHLGVSVNTVHKAVAGKPGVSEATRKRVLAYADECGYHRNEGASSLRRKDVHIVACLPSPENEGRYFFADVWEGCRRYAAESQLTGVRMELLAFENAGYDDLLARVLDRMLAGEKVDGLLAFVPGNERESALLQRISDRGVAIQLVNGDQPQISRIGSVVADYVMAGNLMAEQARNLLRGEKPGARVMLIAGDPYADSHYLLARAFHERLRELGCPCEVDDISSTILGLDDLRTRLTAYLSNVHPALACSVFAGGSHALAEALRETGLAGVIPAIGNDLFSESAEALVDGTFTNVVFKDPENLGYLAAKTLGEYLLWGTRPEAEVQKTPVELVFRSNLQGVILGSLKK